MTLTSEYQYIGRSNAVKDQNSRYSYYILLYAKTSADTATGRHTVTVKQRLVSTTTNVFYGYSTSGKISVAGTTVAQWNWENVPGSAWDITDLTEGGVSYPRGVDLKEGSLAIDVGYGKTKDIVIAGSWTFVSGSAGYLPALNVPAEISATVTLDKIAGISQPSASASSVELGQTVTIYTNRIAGAGLTHTVTYQFGNASGTIAEKVGDSTSWTPPLNLATQIPNAVSGTAIITCTTYASGVAIGSKQMTLTLTVPETVLPKASAVWEDPSGAFALFDTLVQNFSRLSITVSGTGAYGSTIVSAAVKLNGKAYSGGVLTGEGKLPLQVSVTDSRGRVGTASYTISVAAYAAPSFTLSASRCTEDGTADDTGDHAIITVTGYVTQVNDRNASELTLTWGYESQTVSLPAGDIAYQKLVYADPNATMAIAAKLSDMLVSASREMVLSTGYATLDLLAGGKGISFGKAATREGFDCAMPAYFSGNVSGRVLGLGALPQIPSGANFNDYKEFGAFSVRSSAIASSLENCPSTKAGTLRVLSSDGSGNTEAGYIYMIQEYICYDNSATYRRFMQRPGANAAWVYYSWKLIDGCDVIVSEGETDGWTWRKYDNGTAECWYRVDRTKDITKPFGSMYYVAIEAVAFPFSFTGIPVVTATLESIRTLILMSGNGNATKTQTASYLVGRPTEMTGADFTVSYHAIGRWK